jgi:outer membrane protein OmpA-like peptidoglycan-associated protein
MENSKSPDYSSSFTDLMASLAVVFLILAGGVTILLTLKRKSAVGEHVTILKNGIGKIIGNQFPNVNVISDGNTVRVVFANVKTDNNSSLFFELNRYQLAPGQAEFVATTVKEIVNVACTFRETEASKVNLIVLEGHTDSSFNPVGEGCQSGGNSSQGEKSFCNNVRLSSLRASEVFFHLKAATQIGSSLDTCIGEHFLVSGRGSAVPMKKNGNRDNDHTGYNGNDRRVELVFHLAAK